MHMYRIAHLDISLRNLLSDNNGRYCFIDFEMSRRFGLPNIPSHIPNANNRRETKSMSLPDSPRISGYRGTEIPPEVELGQETDPFKVDIWAFGVLILRLAEVNLTIFKITLTLCPLIFTISLPIFNLVLLFQHELLIDVDR